MTEPSPTEPGADLSSAGAPVAMRLRPSRPPVTRLSRKVLLGLGTAAAIGIGGALFVALQPQRQTTGSELYITLRFLADIHAGFLRRIARDLINCPRRRGRAPVVAPANALVLLDRGMSCQSVANVLLIDVTRCEPVPPLSEDGIDGLASFGHAEAPAG